MFFAARHERAPDRRAAVADPGDAHRRPQCVGLGGRPYQPPPRVLRLTAFAALLGFSGLFFAESFAQFFVAMVVINLFVSAQAPLADSLMLAELRGDLGKYGRIRLWGSVGFIVAVVAGGYLLDWFGVGSLLWYCGGLLLLVIGASLRIHDVAAEHHPHATPKLGSVLRQPEVVAFSCRPR
ncbi:MFS transporter [Massilia sp. B-10]|nr:MFS transporter [Massilia sp. B-10]